MFWIGLLILAASIVVGAVLMHRSENFREFISASYHATIAFLRPFLKRTWFWASVSIGGAILGLVIMFQSLSGS